MNGQKPLRWSWKAQQGPDQKAESEFGITKLGDNPYPWKHINREAK